DNNGAKGKDSIQVTVGTVANIAPTANAGIDKTITLPTNNTTLTGTGADADGTIKSYKWTMLSGPSAATFATSNSNTSAINNLVQGIYKFELTVTDNNGAIGKDVVQVTVNAAPNQAPTANAGADLMITLPVNSAHLKGTGVDVDGTIISYSWMRLSGPSAGTMSTPNAAGTKISNLVQGIYSYELTVTDNKHAVGKDTVLVKVGAVPAKGSVATDSILSNAVPQAGGHLSPNGFRIFPNPVINVANLDISTAIGNKVSISVVDIYGKTVKYTELITKLKGSLVRLDLSNLRDGNYFVTLRFSDGQNLSSKIVKIGGN
ncbi:MAG: T9SS type A sorting domain-containing protein, partial [Ferruginibacter sp.]